MYWEQTTECVCKCKFGKSTVKPKREDFNKHEKGNDHKLSAAASEHQTEMKKAVVNANSKFKESTIAIMKTVLSLTQADIPNSKVSTIIELQIENVS